MSMNTFEKFNALDIEFSLLGLEKTNDIKYFCEPKGAKIFARLGMDGVQFCFIEGFDEMVFIISPESVTNNFVNPVSNNFKEFLSLILSCKNTNPIEQIYWSEKINFLNFLSEDLKYVTDEQEEALKIMKDNLNLKAIDDPYDFVKHIQANFDYTQIQVLEE